MTRRQRTRYDAAHILAVAASQQQPLSVREAAQALGIYALEPQALARRELCRSLEAGNWREQRADAEARLR